MRAAVLGHPIAHSLSPVLHRAAYEALGLDWRYDAIDVDEPDLAAFVAGCGPEWAGLSLTMPLKQTVLPLLDHVEPLAQAVGAVNTLLLQHGPGSAVKVGANTDVHGIVAAVREVRTPVAGGGAVILGGGATACSALAALGELGHHAPVVLVRSLARTGAVRRAAHKMGVEPTFALLDRAAEVLPGADVVVSTLPAGAADALGAALDGHTVRGTLLDVVYPSPTPLARAWAGAGGAVAPGERMLLHQAAEQVRLMTDRTPPLEAMDAALTSALAARNTSD